MEKINDGGPAFPSTIPHMTSAGLSHEHGGGMTLRDYFAAHYRADFSGRTFEGEAKERYQYADAMLRERAK